MIRDARKKTDRKSDKAKLPKGVIAVAPPSFRRERALIKRGVWPVAGCDEAGGGPPAGPGVGGGVVRSRQHPAGVAVGARARGACAAGNAEACVRRRPR